jgi:hypothetical protein
LNKRDTILKGDWREFFLLLKAPRQCPFVLIEMHLIEGKALKSE